MFNECLEKDTLVCLDENDELIHRNDAIVKEKTKHLPRYIQLKFRPFTKAGWYFTYLENSFYDDKLRVDVNGNIYRHPYDKKTMSYVADQWVLVTPQKGADGYLQFSWHTHTLQVHRIVAMAWCEKSGCDPDGAVWPEDAKLEVDHIDKDRQHNHPSNLRWVTKTWNANGFRKGLKVNEETGELS